MELVKKTDIGNIIINEKAIKDIVEISTKKIEDIVLASDNSIKCNFNENKLNIELSLKIKQGIDIHQKCKDIQKIIAENIYEMTDIKVNNINIDIKGFIN